MAKHPSRLKTMMSGSFDGEVRIWNLSNRSCERHILAHDGVVRGIAMSADNSQFITVSDDKTIKFWKVRQSDNEEEEEPCNTIISKVSYLDFYKLNHIRIYDFLSVDCTSGHQSSQSSSHVCYLWRILPVVGRIQK